MARDFAAGVPKRLQALEAAHQALTAASSAAPPSVGPALGELQRLAHSLKGAARIFGLPRTADAAADLEAACDAVSKAKGTSHLDAAPDLSDRPDLSVIGHKLQCLRHAALDEARVQQGGGA